MLQYHKSEAPIRWQLTTDNLIQLHNRDITVDYWTRMNKHSSFEKNIVQIKFYNITLSRIFLAVTNTQVDLKINVLSRKGISLL